MKNVWAPILIAMVSAGTLFAHAQLIDETRYHEVSKGAAGYDASWWVAAQYDERDGFLDGAGDCLAWTAQIGKGFFHTSRSMDGDVVAKEITTYYADHPADKKLSVIRVWQKMSHRIGEETPTPRPGGEVYTNPHGFLDGDWYRQSSEADRYGFLEGYIGCVRTYAQASDQPQTYSRPIHYYDDKIWDYVAAHNAYNEPIANILYRFRDMPKSKPPQAK